MRQTESKKQSDKAIVTAKINPDDRNKLDIWVEIQRFLDDCETEKVDLNNPNVIVRKFR